MKKISFNLHAVKQPECEVTLWLLCVQCKLIFYTQHRSGLFQPPTTILPYTLWENFFVVGGSANSVLVPILDLKAPSGVRLNMKGLSYKLHQILWPWGLMIQFNREMCSANFMVSLGAVLTFIPWRAEMCYLNFSTICT